MNKFKLHGRNQICWVVTSSVNIFMLQFLLLYAALTAGHKNFMSMISASEKGKGNKQFKKAQGNLQEYTQRLLFLFGMKWWIALMFIICISQSFKILYSMNILVLWSREKSHSFPVLLRYDWQKLYICRLYHVLLKGVQCKDLIYVYIMKWLPQSS